MSARVTSTRLIGRAGELAECEAALREAAAGRPSVVALSGDSGVGKSRLVAELAAREQDRARFLRGDCVELEGGELPYAPLIGALRELARGHDPALDGLSAVARSSLAALLPALGGDERLSPDDESAQLRLFESLLELLEALGEAQPVVLAIEDLHWADRSTRAFTAFLARSLRSERVLLLLSYRTDELHRRHPLRPLLAELERSERTRRITLRPWGRDELGEALTDILGAPPDEGLLSRLYARGEGNPLYTEELLAAGLDGRGAAPQSLRDAFMLRLERLAPDTQAVLRVLAVARIADEPLLAEVLDGPPAPDVTVALREAIAGHVIEAGQDGRFGFRHALLREVAYEDLLPSERAELHLRLAHTLDARRACAADDDGLAAQVAAHAYAAGDRPLALRSAIAAAELASAIHAHGEAADHLERALQLWERIDDVEALAGLDHAELLVRTAREHEHIQQRARSEAILRTALSELDPSAEPVRSALVLEQLARAQWGLARGDEALTNARRALELLPPGRADRERAGVLAWIARVTALRGHFRDAVAAAREALQLAEASGAGPHVSSQARNTLGMALAGSGRVDDGLVELRESLAAAQRGGDAYGTFHAYGNLSDLLFIAGRTAEGLAVAQEGLAAVSPSLRSYHVWLAAQVSEIAFAAGEWALAARSLALGERAIEGRWLINLRLREAELALGLGRPAAAEAALGEIADLVKHAVEPQFHAGFGLALADLRRRRGDLEGARGALQDALDEIEVCTDDAMRVAAIGAAGVAVEADIAQRARDVDDAEALRSALLEAEIHLSRVRAAAEDAGPVEAVWVLTAEAEMARAAGGNDPALWDRAAAGWAGRQRAYLEARTRWRQAEAHVECGDRAAAADAVGAALARARAMGSAWLVGELEALAARARLAPSGQDGDGDGRASAAREIMGDPFGLTARERQVLALVARGATNREIGAELFMAEKTASVHVSRILAKLDVRSRTQAAAVAHRAGIVTPEAMP